MSDPSKNLFDLLLDQIRAVVREEIAKALSQRRPARLNFSTAEAADMLGVTESSHTARFATRVFRSATPIDETKLREVLDQLPRGVLRLKGFVRLHSNPERLRLVQGVGTRWTISDAGSNVEQEGCALVVIGAKELLGDEGFSRIQELF